MNQIISGLKLKTIQFYLKKNLIIAATLILIKLTNFIKIYKKIFNYFIKIFNSENNFFFKKNLKLFFIKQVTKIFLNLLNFSDSLFNEKIWKNFYPNKTFYITGLTIGKGTAGNIKKHNFSRGPVSHGSKHLRLQGSLGSGTSPGRTLPGKRMSGHLGYSFKTVQSKILLINPKDKIILVKGSIPGKNNTLLLLK